MYCSISRRVCVQSTYLHSNYQVACIILLKWTHTRIHRLRNLLWVFINCFKKKKYPKFWQYSFPYIFKSYGVRSTENSCRYSLLRNITSITVMLAYQKSHSYFDEFMYIAVNLIFHLLYFTYRFESLLKIFSTYFQLERNSCTYVTYVPILTCYVYKVFFRQMQEAGTSFVEHWMCALQTNTTNT